MPRSSPSHRPPNAPPQPSSHRSPPLPRPRWETRKGLRAPRWGSGERAGAWPEPRPPSPRAHRSPLTATAHEPRRAPAPTRKARPAHVTRPARPHWPVRRIHERFRCILGLVVSRGPTAALLSRLRLCLGLWPWCIAPAHRPGSARLAWPASAVLAQPQQGVGIAEGLAMRPCCCASGQRRYAGSGAAFSAPAPLVSLTPLLCVVFPVAVTLEVKRRFSLDMRGI